MFFRAFIVWVALLALAVVNGASRETWLVPRIGGPAGHAASSLSLSAAILLLAWLTIAMTSKSAVITLPLPVATASQPS